jgi:VCBS repeat-containing protein
MSLSPSYTFVGNGNWSLDATSGSATGGGDIQIHVPTGSHVEKAFLYETTFFTPGSSSVTLTSGANTATVSSFTSLGVNGFLEAFRSDVTGYVQTIVGSGSATDFTVSLSGVGGGVDGFALAVVYSNSAESLHTITFLDGFSASSGDNFTLNFPTPVDTTPAGFSAQLSLGIGFGFQPSGQYSTVKVDGRQLTTSAGGQDDGIGGNGGLITIGGLGDSSDNPNPTVTDGGGPRTDDELYDLSKGNSADSTPFLANGSTSIHVDTLNPSSDDNIFFAGFNITAKTVVDTNQNDPPVAVGDIGAGFATNEATAFTTANVLANDFDPENDPLTVISLDTTGTNGLVTSNGDGTFNYNPNGAYNALNTGDTAVDTFKYTISDGQGHTATATVSITVQGVSEMTEDCNNIYGSIYTDFLSGTAGNDCIFAVSPDDVSFNNFGDYIDAGAGNDKVYSGNFNDFILGGDGNDIVYANGGDDWVDGGAGNDFLEGNDGNDTLKGGDGNDILSGGEGSNFLDGGAGDDTLWAGSGNSTFHFEGAGFGNDQVAGYHDGSSLYFEAGLFNTGIVNASSILQLKDAVLASVTAHATLFGNGGENLKISFDTGDSVILYGNGLEWQSV